MQCDLDLIWKSAWRAASYLIQSPRWSCHRWGPSMLFRQWWRGGPWRGLLHWAPGGGGDGGPRPPRLLDPCGCGKRRMPKPAAGRARTLGRQSPLRGPQGPEEGVGLSRLLDRKEADRESIRKQSIYWAVFLMVLTLTCMQKVIKMWEIKWGCELLERFTWSILMAGKWQALSASHKPGS